MITIDFTTPVVFGENTIDRIQVKPLKFGELVKIWASVSSSAKPEAALKRRRIHHQTIFEAGGKRITPTEENITQLPRLVAKDIIAALEEGTGPVGSLVNEGDGITSPLLYKLGTPIETKSSGGKTTKIEELEFAAETYGQVEDILAADNDLEKTWLLLKSIAKPVDSPLLVLPSWALDSITVGDGVTIMQKVLPSF